jgi:hypothetical protein
LIESLCKQFLDGVSIFVLELQFQSLLLRLSDLRCEGLFYRQLGLLQIILLNSIVNSLLSCMIRMKTVGHQHQCCFSIGCPLPEDLHSMPKMGCPRCMDAHSLVWQENKQSLPSFFDET